VRDAAQPGGVGGPHNRLCRPENACRLLRQRPWCRHQEAGRRLRVGRPRRASARPASSRGIPCADLAVAGGTPAGTLRDHRSRSRRSGRTVGSTVPLTPTTKTRTIRTSSSYSTPPDTPSASSEAAGPIDPSQANRSCRARINGVDGTYSQARQNGSPLCQDAVAVRGVWSALSPGSDCSEVSIVGIGSAALD
jgi:hypothetical protein